MNNNQLLKTFSFAIVSTIMFSSCAHSNEAKSTEAGKAAPLSHTINILFDDKGCPVGALGGSDDPVSVGADVTFVGQTVQEYATKKGGNHPSFQIGFSPFHPLKSSKKGKVHYKAISTLPAGKLKEYRFTYTVFAEDCYPVDPVIIIEQ